MTRQVSRRRFVATSGADGATLLTGSTGEDNGGGTTPTADAMMDDTPTEEATMDATPTDDVMEIEPMAPTEVERVSVGRFSEAAATTSRIRAALPCMRLS